MGYKIYVMIFLLCVSSLNAQSKKIISKKRVCQGIETKYNGNFTFSTTVVTNCDLYDGINFMIGIKDFQLDGYIYKGINSETLEDVSFPIKLKSPTVNVTTTLRFKNNHNHIDIDKKFVWVDDGSWGGLDRHWLEKEEQEKIFKTFGITEDDKEIFYDLSIDLMDIVIDVSYYSGKIGDTLNPIKKRIKNQK